MMTSRHFLITGLAALLIITVWACTELVEGVNTHPEDWDDPVSAAFHGLKVSAAGLQSCKQCHGEDLDSGFTGVSCAGENCHTGVNAIPHPLTGFTDPADENYHGRIFWENDWDFSGCQSCHGTDLDGGVVDYSCSNTACHTPAEGVFACDNCHYREGDAGSFVDVQNRTDSTLVTVGMHTSHILARHSLTAPLDCSTCHVLPDSVFAAGHLEDSDSDVTFDSLATAKGTLSPVWDHSAGTCSDVYCHGAFDFNGVTGNDSPWIWTDSLAGDNLCDTCHGYPPTGHMSVVNCGSCHKSVVGADHLSIIDTQKHINGRADYP